MDRLVVVDGLDVEARSAFVATARAAIDEAARSSCSATAIDLDCSLVKSLDQSTLATLVIVARAAHRRGVPVTLIGTSPRVRATLDDARVSHFFDLGR